MHALVYFYGFTAVFNVPFNAIAMMENFEAIPTTRKYLCDNSGNLSGKRIVMGRILALFLATSVTFITDDLTRTMNFAGSIGAPVTSFIIPVI